MEEVNEERIEVGDLQQSMDPQLAADPQKKGHVKHIQDECMREIPTLHQ